MSKINKKPIDIKYARTLRKSSGCKVEDIVKTYGEFLTNVSNISTNNEIKNIRNFEAANILKLINLNENIIKKNSAFDSSIPEDLLKDLQTRFDVNAEVIKILHDYFIYSMLALRDQYVQELCNSKEKVESADSHMLCYVNETDPNIIKIIRFTMPADLCHTNQIYNLMQTAINYVSNKTSEQKVQEELYALMTYANSFIDYKITNFHSKHQIYIAARDQQIPSSVQINMKVFSDLVIIEHDNGDESGLQILGSKIISDDNITMEILKEICTKNKFLEEKWNTAKILDFKKF